MASIITAWQTWWTAFALPVFVTNALVSVCLITIGYGFIRAVVSIFRCPKFRKLIDIIYLVIAIGTVLYYVLPNVIPVIHISHDLKITGAVPVTTVTEVLQ